MLFNVYDYSSIIIGQVEASDIVEAWSEAGKKYENFLDVKLAYGTCYEDAWRFLIKEGEGELIHGTVFTENRRIGHAWVETETGYIWEPQTGNYFTQEGFSIAAEPIEEHRYTIEQASIMLARVGKHGPWTEEERNKWLKK